MSRLTLLICGLLLLVPAVSHARPQEDGRSAAELDQLMAEVAAELRCPVCRNQSVLESSSGLARQMQSVIREQLAAGKKPEEVKEYFVGRYGDWILLKPEPKGINLLVYLLPAVALLGGGALLFRQMRRWTGSTGTAAASTDDDSVGPEPAIDRSESASAAGLPARPEGGLSEDEEEWIRQQIGSLG